MNHPSRIRSLGAAIVKRNGASAGDPEASTEALDREIQLSVHILGVSAALVGVCLTVIGLLQVVERLRNLNTPADDILAVDAVLFLIACLLAYSSLRSPEPARRRRLERVADGCFICALAVMTFVAAAVAFELSDPELGTPPRITSTSAGPSLPCTACPPLRWTERARPAA